MIDQCFPVQTVAPEIKTPILYIAQFSCELTQTIAFGFLSQLTVEVSIALRFYTVGRAVCVEMVREPLLESPFCHFKPLTLALSPLTFVLRDGILAHRPACSLYHFPTLPLSVNPGDGVKEKSIGQSAERNSDQPVQTDHVRLDSATSVQSKSKKYILKFNVWTNMLLGTLEVIISTVA